jgi:hypothetical protein
MPHFRKAEMSRNSAPATGGILSDTTMTNESSTTSSTDSVKFSLFYWLVKHWTLTIFYWAFTTFHTQFHTQIGNFSEILLTENAGRRESKRLRSFSPLMPSASASK